MFLARKMLLNVASSRMKFYKFFGQGHSFYSRSRTLGRGTPFFTSALRLPYFVSPFKIPGCATACF